MLNINSIEKEILNFSPSKNLNKTGYSDLFYDHITSMLKFRMMSDCNDVDTLNLSNKTYFGLEEFILEHTGLVEADEPNPDDIDWNTIDMAKDLFTQRIKNTLGKERNSETLKPIIDFTVNTYENSLVYKYLHPKSLSNPWIQTDHIFFQNGYLVLVSDEKEFVESFNKKIVDSVDENSSDLFVVATSGKSKKFAGFSVDTRNKVQGLVYEFLKREGSGFSCIKKSRDIVAFLKSQKIFFTAQKLKVKVLLPLKRAGLIGSTTQGYFHIATFEDLQHSYTHHKEKIAGIQKTLEIYKSKAFKMNRILK